MEILPVNQSLEPSLMKLTLMSKRIEESTRVLTESLRSRGLEPPSFDATGPADFPLLEVDSAALQARQDVITLTKELYNLVLGPREGLRIAVFEAFGQVSLQAVCEFKIAEAVPLTGSISYQDLVGKVKHLVGITLPFADLRRIVRLAIVHNLFCEPEVGFVAHNRASLLLLEDEKLANWVAMFAFDNVRPIINTIPAMKKWPGSQEPNKTAINLAYDHDLSFFEHVKADRDRAKRYDLAMAAHGTREGFEFIHTVQGYPWYKLGRTSVVDLGGNGGLVAMAIAEVYPALSFVVQDLPEVRASNSCDTVPAHLADRVQLTSHDFFQEQPVVAQAYFFRHIFHAFSDKYAVQILRALVPSLRHGARVIINELVLPPPGSVSPIEERSIRYLDVLMQMVCNSRERDADEWRVLFEQADPRFQWQGAWKSSGRLWFIEAIWNCE